MGYTEASFLLFLSGFESGKLLALEKVVEFSQQYTKTHEFVELKKGNKRNYLQIIDDSIDDLGKPGIEELLTRAELTRDFGIYDKEGRVFTTH